MTATAQESRYETAPQFDDAVEVLSDEYACRILCAVSDGAMPAADVAKECDMCRQTVYRRLDRLESIGFVTSQAKHEPEGPQRRYFQLVVDEMHFEIGENGVDERVSPARSAAD